MKVTTCFNAKDTENYLKNTKILKIVSKLFLLFCLAMANALKNSQTSNSLSYHLILCLIYLSYTLVVEDMTVVLYF